MQGRVGGAHYLYRMTATISRDYVNHPPVDPAREDQRRFRITLSRYHEWIASGALTENDHVELIFGQLIPTMPISDRHAETVDLLTEYFVPRFAATHVCRSQNPIQMPDHSEPEPDFALISKQRYQRGKGHPRPDQTDLLIEVAQSTLSYDRNTKRTLYALESIPEYWIINLQDDQVEVHTDCDASTGTYRKVITYSFKETIESPCCGKVEVTAILPPAN